MRIFLSYSSKNKDFARRLAADLERAGTGVWLDEHSMRVGTGLAAIEPAIRESDCLVVVLSAAAVESEWVDREIELAQQFDVRVLPVLLEDVQWNRQSRFTGLSHADFRRRQDYRRATQRLIAAIEGDTDQSRFLRAKEAIALVRSRWSPSGELFGVSQQGVATLYSLANAHDWEVADATDGTSRFWVAEFFDASRNLITAYAVMDGKVRELPEMYLYGTDPEPLPDSKVVFSCALNHLENPLGEPTVETLENSDGATTISRRYSRFRPVVLEQDFVDSATAVASATTAFEPDELADDLLVLTKLECDKRYRELPTWTVAFFDPTLSESVATVGVNAVTGVVRHPRMRTEILNADFFGTRLDAEGNVVLSVANQFKAMENHIWDITTSGDPLPFRLTAAEALEMAVELLDSEGGAEHWQVAYLSNTGVVSTALSPRMSSPEAGLMKRGGGAGQWVVEVCGTSATLVRESGREGYHYPYHRILCTRADGAVMTGDTDGLILTAALTRTPLAQDFLACYDRARRFAVQVAAVDFTVMSVALQRTPPEATWHFRFYGAEDILTMVTVSVDGQRLVAFGPPQR